MENWNLQWGTIEEIKSFWNAIDTGNLKVLKKHISDNPKLPRWECNDRPLDKYAKANSYNPKVLKFLLSIQGL